jgi:hypothetical protein
MAQSTAAYTVAVMTMALAAVPRIAIVSPRRLERDANAAL